VLITLSSLVEKVEAVDAAPEFKLKDLIAQSEDTGNAQKFGEPMKRKNNKIKKPRMMQEAVVAAAELSGDSDGNIDVKTDDKDNMSRFD
jgi:iron uptake system EfeUOB component EfeO/EfeM